MRIVLKLFAAAVAVGAVLLVSVSAVSADQGFGPPQVAPDSYALMYGGSDGVYSGSGPPVSGYVYAVFEKGGEAYKSSTTTSVVDFTLPEGVTVASDPECANLDGLGDNYCLQTDGDCAPPTAITLDGNTVSFQIACDTGEEFSWGGIGAVNSLIMTDGFYSTSVQFKLGPYQRTKNPDNMWQINPTDGEFDVPFNG